MYLIAIQIITYFVLTMAAAWAETDVPRCVTEPVHFDPARNETVYPRSRTPAGQSCSHFFAAGGLVAIDQVEIVARPKSGTLDRSGELRVVYRPRPGFAGEDTYRIKLCGSSLQGRGCTTAIYTITVYEVPGGAAARNP